MVKLYCDRCKEELDKKYYTFSFYEYDTDPCYDPITACTAAYASSETRIGALRMLNSQKMYCKKCKNEIEKFINKE